jgi:outer membrane immunogenic protein
MRYRNLLLAASVLGAIGGSTAFAADMPTKAYTSPLNPAPVTTWTGFYVGVNAGYGWANVGNPTGGAGSSNNLTGFVGGGQLGYNWQVGALVFGLEADIQGSAQKRSDTATILGIPFTVDQKIPWFATARGRLGYAFGPWMLYATGGAAWLNYKLSVSALGTTVSDNATKAAWTLGGGVEWMMIQNWSAKLEYLYIDTGSTSVTLFGVPFNARAKDNLVRVGLNYHF